MRRPDRRVMLAEAAVLLGLGGLACPALAQTMERRYEPDATGAVTVIYPGENAMGAPNVVELLQWNVPGLVVERLADGAVKVILRANCMLDSSSNPLLFVDGIPIMNSQVSPELQSLNPFMVERIEIVRDAASTAVYGARAQCGVIRIFTRRRTGT